MSPSPRVLRHPRAERDIEEQVDHYLFVEGLPAVAARFVDAIQDALELLAEFPAIGSPCRLAAAGLTDLREWRVTGFRNHVLFYRPATNGIELVRVVHAARDRGRALER